MSSSSFSRTKCLKYPRLKCNKTWFYTTTIKLRLITARDKLIFDPNLRPICYSCNHEARCWLSGPKNQTITKPLPLDWWRLLQVITKYILPNIPINPRLSPPPGIDWLVLAQLSVIRDFMARLSPRIACTGARQKRFHFGGHS